MKGLYEYYENIAGVMSGFLNDKIKVLSEINDKIENSNVDGIKNKFEETKKEIVKYKSSTMEKRQKIEKKLALVNEKMNKIQLNNEQVLTRYHKIKGFFDDHLNRYKTLKQTSVELKKEISSLMEETKTMKVDSQRLNPKLISRDLIDKQLVFQKNLKKLLLTLMKNFEQLEIIKKELNLK